MSNILLILLATMSFSALAMDISCPKDEIELSRKDHQLFRVKSSDYDKGRRGYTVSIPATFKGHQLKEGQLLIGNKVGSELFAPLKLHSDPFNLNSLFVYVNASETFKYRRYVQVTYGSCLTQLVELR